MSFWRAGCHHISLCSSQNTCSLVCTSGQRRDIVESDRRCWAGLCLLPHVFLSLLLMGSDSSTTRNKALTSFFFHARIYNVATNKPHSQINNWCHLKTSSKIGYSLIQSFLQSLILLKNQGKAYIWNTSGGDGQGIHTVIHVCETVP